jgi:hypothetical protein
VVARSLTTRGGGGAILDMFWALSDRYGFENVFGLETYFKNCTQTSPFFNGSEIWVLNLDPTLLQYNGNPKKRTFNTGNMKKADK